MKGIRRCKQSCFYWLVHLTLATICVSFSSIKMWTINYISNLSDALFNTSYLHYYWYSYDIFWNFLLIQLTFVYHCKMKNGAIACFTQRIISLHISIDKNDFSHLSLNISNVNIYSVGNVPVVEVDCVVNRIVKIV